MNVKYKKKICLICNKYFNAINLNHTNLYSKDEEGYGNYCDVCIFY